MRLFGEKRNRRRNSALSTGEIQPPTYDDNGNLTAKTDKVTTDVTGYAYDAQNQLIQITFPDLTTANYRYDGVGRRIEKDVAGVITRYVYDRKDIVLEYDGTNTLLARYSHGPGRDRPLAMERGGLSFFYQADHQGSIRLVTDAAGFVVNAYEYDSYGNIESAVEGVPNPFTYTGREFDAESGLYYYRYRYYDSNTGRFLAEDPTRFAAGDLNLYRYVFNNPVNLRDPLGLVVSQNCRVMQFLLWGSTVCAYVGVGAAGLCAGGGPLLAVACGLGGFTLCMVVVDEISTVVCDCDTSTCSGPCGDVEECEDHTCPKDEGSS